MTEANKEEAEKALSALKESLHLSMLEEMKRREENRVASQPPVLTRKGFAAQAEFNCSVISKILESPQSTDQVLVEAVKLLKDRNALLVSADKDPRVFELLEAQKKVQAATAAGATDNSLSNLLLMQTLLNSKSDDRSRKRRANSPSPPFHSRGSSRRYDGSRNSNHELAGEIADIRRAMAHKPYDQGAGTRFGKGGIKCHKCFQYGHMQAQCRK